jgi:hypothetical protein
MVELDLGFVIWLDFGWFFVGFTGRLEWVDGFGRWVFWVVGFWVDFGRRVVDWWWFLLVLDEGCGSGGLRREARSLEGRNEEEKRRKKYEEREKKLK